MPARRLQGALTTHAGEASRRARHGSLGTWTLHAAPRSPPSPRSLADRQNFSFGRFPGGGLLVGFGVGVGFVVVVVVGFGAGVVAVGFGAV